MTVERPAPEMKKDIFFLSETFSRKVKKENAMATKQEKMGKAVNFKSLLAWG